MNIDHCTSDMCSDRKLNPECPRKTLNGVNKVKCQYTISPSNIQLKYIQHPLSMLSEFVCGVKIKDIMAKCFRVIVQYEYKYYQIK